MLDSGRGYHERAALELIVSRMGDLLRSRISLFKGSCPVHEIAISRTETFLLCLVVYQTSTHHAYDSIKLPQTCLERTPILRWNNFRVGGVREVIAWKQ